MKKENENEDLILKERGVVEDGCGRVAGFWIRGRRGRQKTFLFEKPIKRADPYRIERKTISVDGRTFYNVPVKVCPPASSFTHWGKYASKSSKKEE